MLIQHRYFAKSEATTNQVESMTCFLTQTPSGLKFWNGGSQADTYGV
jgi:hypothetical protein